MKVVVVGIHRAQLSRLDPGCPCRRLPSTVGAGKHSEEKNKMKFGEEFSLACFDEIRGAASVDFRWRRRRFQNASLSVGAQQEVSMVQFFGGLLP